MHITYNAVAATVNKMANVLKGLGRVAKGDRVVIYMPMIPEAAYAMLACARIGAIHSIVFAGFLARSTGCPREWLRSQAVVTADEAPRGGRNTPLKANVDKALAICGTCRRWWSNAPAAMSP